MTSYFGIDVGAETLKLVALTRAPDGALQWSGRWIVEHAKRPMEALLALLAERDGSTVEGAAVCGRLGGGVRLPRVPAKQAQALACRFLHGAAPKTLVSIGSHGFTVLELRESGVEVFRENSRCSQGTGNFLRQLIERFDLTIDEASRLVEGVADPAPLSGRCPVILKTDMTHLANKGEDRARILAGLYDAVAENVQVLIKPRLAPPEVLLIGGVARSRRLRENFRSFLDSRGMRLCESAGDDALYYEALGAALQAAAAPERPVALEALVAEVEHGAAEWLPPLTEGLKRVKRMTAPEPRFGERLDAGVLLGFDIGSTGSKAVAITRETGEVVWEGYLKTNGAPVEASQNLMRQFAEAVGERKIPILGLGATGSGREIVGSLMASCYGPKSVFVMNEIAAHAEGALHFDPRVDTIFEIGGQDAKYIRLNAGRIVDAAMNEACSAGTGSFIEEQGKKFSGVSSIAQLGAVALEARRGVSLGQHCSVFMAEIIDEAVGQGVESEAIVAGIYDSIIQNYLNRVKGSRSVGEVIFCQGMPFASDALAAAVARQTGSEVVVPPNPGTVGALGIALLARKNLLAASARPLEPARLLSARVEKKDTFVCPSTKGCGKPGNRCRIDRIATVVEEVHSKFMWGGGCSLYDSGTRKQKLPDRTPDPFREREALIAELLERVGENRGRKRIALSDEFMLKGLFPFFATLLFELGFDLEVFPAADHAMLKRGIEEANVPFCAPMQQFHGLASAMADAPVDFLFLPRMRELTRAGGEKHAMGCPIVQASPEMLGWDLGARGGAKRITTLIDLGSGNLQSKELRESCERLAADLGISTDAWRDPLVRAVAAQQEFEARCRLLGARALAFCEERGVTAVVVLGRAYTLYNGVLNSNVPAILREQGALAIPIDCYPLDEETPVFETIYWSYGQTNLRAAHQARRTPGVYALYCSNYSCGPDSFILPFFSHIMDGKPFAVIETDGHSGDAGTKTRVEAFLHCVREDLAASRPVDPVDFKELSETNGDFQAILDRKRTLLIPRMGSGAEPLAAALRALGIDAEALEFPNREVLQAGRRHTSGKECVPLTLTLGGLVHRVTAEPDPERRFAFLMPQSYGPCRFGLYNVLQKTVLARLGWRERVEVFSPAFEGYAAQFPPGFGALMIGALWATDLLLQAGCDLRPFETEKGSVDAVLDAAREALCHLLESTPRSDLSKSGALWQVASGQLFGIRRLLEETGRTLASFPRGERPTVLVVGEIYVRCDPFANDFIVEKLEARGLRAKVAPFCEWLEYADYINVKNGDAKGVGGRLPGFLREVIQDLLYRAIGGPLGWGRRSHAVEALEASAPYIREELQGEAVLTLGGPIHEWHAGRIDAVVSVGPLECMPNKIAESQFFHVAEREGLPSLTLSLNGDPIPSQTLDNFAFEVRQRAMRRGRATATA